MSQYQISRSNFEILTDLAQRKQHANESVDSFFHTMGQIRTKLVQPISEFDMIKIMKKNIKENIGRIVYPIQVTSVEQLRIECNEAEKNFLRRENKPAFTTSRPIRQVSELHEEMDLVTEQSYADEEIEVSAVQNDRRLKPQLTCWNCRKTGHGFRECEETTRSLFCYKCGNPGTTTPKCGICQQGNYKKGVEMEGGSRPNYNPGK